MPSLAAVTDLPRVTLQRARLHAAPTTTGYAPQRSNHNEDHFQFLTSLVWVKKCVKWTVPDQEVDQRGLGERLCKMTVKHVN